MKYENEPKPIGFFMKQNSFLLNKRYDWDKLGCK